VRRLKSEPKTDIRASSVFAPFPGRLGVALLPFICLFTPSAMAVENTAVLRGTLSTACGEVEAFGGEVQLFDPTRTRVIEVSKKASVPCGGWVSVGPSEGWILVHQRDGYQVNLGTGAFVQFPSAHEGGAGKDALVVFRGQAYVKSLISGSEIQLITPNARARLGQGTVLFSYQSNESQSQLISLEGRASIENRFAGQRRIQLNPGEASSLDFQSLRVVPSTPQAVSLASVDARLKPLFLDETSRGEALAAIRKRAERKLAARLPIPPKVSASQAEEQKDVQTLAHKKWLETYARHSANPENEALKKKLAQRIFVGGVGAPKAASDTSQSEVPSGEAIGAPGEARAAQVALSPKKSGRTLASNSASATRPAGHARGSRVIHKADSDPGKSEKKRLIDELARIRPTED